MCPAARSKEGLDRMSAASSGWCALCQVICSRDPLGQFLHDTLHPNRTYEVHNDREIILTVFSRLWNQGYEPELSYVAVRTNPPVLRKKQRALCREFRTCRPGTGADLTALIRDYACGGESVFPADHACHTAMESSRL
jgi:hypothetical protein